MSDSRLPALRPQQSRLLERVQMPLERSRKPDLTAGRVQKDLEPSDWIQHPEHRMLAFSRARAAD
jgi:hypothetical protein